MTRPAPAPRVSHQEIAEQAKATPGEWLPVRAYRTGYQAKSVASQIRLANARMEAYSPAGSFEARTVNTADDTELFVRYVGHLGAPADRVQVSAAKLRSLLAGGASGAGEQA